MLSRLAIEPPFRIFVRAILKWLPVSVKTRCYWEISKRPNYLLGVFTAALLATEEAVNEICVVEFGVAGGEGLLALQEAASLVESETGVKIEVYGFDAGAQGLPQLCGDYRDHPDFWKAGDFRMDVDALKSKLDHRTQLIIGEVADTVPHFVSEVQKSPLGFAAFDLDLYSSTRNALQVFSLPSKRMLKHVPLYFDDIEFIVNHRFAGELLAIDEFNQVNDNVKIDRWYGVKNGRPFPERGYFDKMYVAHNLRAITNTTLERDNVQLNLK